MLVEGLLGIEPGACSRLSLAANAVREEQLRGSISDPAERDLQPAWRGLREGSIQPVKPPILQAKPYQRFAIKRKNHPLKKTIYSVEF
jgi:hypothetical protein